MPQFIVRVELHGADEEDYDTLHDAMEAHDFSRTISSADAKYRLPPAEYHLLGAQTQSQVEDLATAGANRTGLKFSIMVIEAACITWLGLKKAD